MTYPLVPKVLMLCALAVALSFEQTAAEDREREGGLTGTGIVGEITALGSIIVNDQRIVFPPDMPVTNSVSRKTASGLVPGEVVAVAVSPDETDWTADVIRQVHALVGPVAVAADGRITVLGVDVQWQGAVPAIGTWVAVSGFWTQNGVAATLLETLDPRPTATILGSYRKDPSGPSTIVGSETLTLDPLQHAREGDVIEVTGTINGGTFKVTDVQVGLFDEPVWFVLAEGYLTDVAPSGHYTVAGSGLSAYTDGAQSNMATGRIRVCGFDGQMTVPQSGSLDELIQRLGCPNVTK